MTSYRRLKGRNFGKEVVDIGECVWYLKPKSKGRKKLESRWGSGVWLGIRDETNEVMIGTQEGIIKVRTIRRKASNEERWNITQLENMKGTPWEPVPGSDDREIRSKIRVRTEQENRDSPNVAEAVVEKRKRAEYRFPIKRKDVDKYGMSEDCEGCRRLALGDPNTRPHTESCRDRFGMLFLRDGDPRTFQEMDRLQRQGDLAREVVESLAPPEAIRIPDDMEVTEEEDKEGA